MSVAIMSLFSFAIVVIEERRTIWKAVWLVEEESSGHIPLHTRQPSSSAVATSPQVADDPIAASSTPSMSSLSNSLEVKEMSGFGANVIRRQTK
jgi:hypothetical protein